MVAIKIKEEVIYLNKEPVTQMQFGPGLLFWFLAPIHEFGHWIVYKIYGIEVYFTLNQVVPKISANLSC